MSASSLVIDQRWDLVPRMHITSILRGDLTPLYSQVCGLKWSHDDRELASGGNDNQLLVWNQRSQHPVLRLTEHTAAVKAIAWSPHQQGLLASGGGTADRCIRFWNTANGNVLNSIDTGSQASRGSECKWPQALCSTVVLNSLSLAGLQPCLVQKCEWAREHTRVFSKSNHGVEISIYVKGELTHCGSQYLIYQQANCIMNASSVCASSMTSIVCNLVFLSLLLINNISMLSAETLNQEMLKQQWNMD